MIRQLALLSALAFASAGMAFAQSGGDHAKRPLDLPSGGKGDDEDEEDAPETITFYGGEYEGDGFFWCLDKSGSMSWNDEIAQLKSETISAIQSLSENADFSLVAFSTGHIVWSNTPKEANPANVAGAIAWVSALQAEGWTCLGPAGVELVEISNQSDKPEKRVLVLSDGEPYCNGDYTGPECLTNITAANWQHTPIDTIYISADSLGITFMQQLAALNGGTFHQPPG